MRVAVIPARGGSKRISRKNVRPFCGAPMLTWPVRTALASGLFDDVIVSTEDAEIADCARAAGACVCPRPVNLADDYTPTVPVVAHVVDWLLSKGAHPSSVCCIYATAVFMHRDDLALGYAALERGPFDYAVSVTRHEAPVQRALRITDQGSIEFLYPEYVLTRTQDLEPTWRDAGQFYWGRLDAWRERRPIFASWSAPVPVPRKRALDIDTPDDWELAETHFRFMEHGSECA